MKIIVTIEMDDYGQVIDQKVEQVAETKSKVDYSDYARYFSEGCIGWTKDSERNLLLLKARQAYANNMLRLNKRLYLNEVYDMLGIPRSKAGEVVGWIYDEENPIGDNYVDFGIYDNRNIDFINGNDNKALLDFNVDGDIKRYLWYKALGI